MKHTPTVPAGPRLLDELSPAHLADRELRRWQACYDQQHVRLPTGAIRHSRDSA
jgi:hypothetical protein